MSRRISLIFDYEIPAVIFIIMISIFLNAPLLSFIVVILVILVIVVIVVISYLTYSFTALEI